MAAIVALIVGIVVVGRRVRPRDDQPHLPRGAGARAGRRRRSSSAGALAGVALAAFAEVVTWVLAALLLSAPLGAGAPRLRGRDASRSSGRSRRAARSPAVLGVGFGLLVRRQTAAIVVAFVWLLVGEPLLSIADVQQYAPGHAVASVVVAGTPSSELLSFWPGLLLALAYAAGFAALGAVAVKADRRRLAPPPGTVPGCGRFGPWQACRRCDEASTTGGFWPGCWAGGR